METQTHETVTSNISGTGNIFGICVICVGVLPEQKQFKEQQQEQCLQGQNLNSSSNSNLNRNLYRNSNISGICVIRDNLYLNSNLSGICDSSVSSVICVIRDLNRNSFGISVRSGGCGDRDFAGSGSFANQCNQRNQLWAFYREQNLNSFNNSNCNLYLIRNISGICVISVICDRNSTCTASVTATASLHCAGTGNICGISVISDDLYRNRNISGICVGCEGIAGAGNRFRISDRGEGCGL